MRIQQKIAETPAEVEAKELGEQMDNLIADFQSKHPDFYVDNVNFHIGIEKTKSGPIIYNQKVEILIEPK